MPHQDLINGVVGYGVSSGAQKITGSGFMDVQRTCLLTPPYPTILTCLNQSLKNNCPPDRASPVRGQGHHWPTHLNVSFMTFGMIELQLLERRLIMFTAKNAFFQI